MGETGETSEMRVGGMRLLSGWAKCLSVIVCAGGSERERQRERVRVVDTVVHHPGL